MSIRSLLERVRGPITVQQLLAATKRALRTRAQAPRSAAGEGTETSDFEPWKLPSGLIRFRLRPDVVNELDLSTVRQKLKDSLVDWQQENSRRYVWLQGAAPEVEIEFDEGLRKQMAVDVVSEEERKLEPPAVGWLHVEGLNAPIRIHAGERHLEIPGVPGEFLVLAGTSGAISISAPKRVRLRNGPSETGVLKLKGDARFQLVGQGLPKLGLRYSVQKRQPQPVPEVADQISSDGPRRWQSSWKGWLVPPDGQLRQLRFDVPGIDADVEGAFADPTAIEVSAKPDTLSIGAKTGCVFVKTREGRLRSLTSDEDPFLADSGTLVTVDQLELRVERTESSWLLITTPAIPNRFNGVDLLDLDHPGLSRVRIPTGAQLNGEGLIEFPADFQREESTA